VYARLLRKLSGALDAAGIPYMVIGGQAVLLHGQARATLDIDITLGVDVEAFVRVIDAAGKIGLEPIPEDPEAFARKTMVLPAKDGDSGIRVDFIFSFLPYERQAIERAVIVPIDGVPVRFASVEDLVIHKMFAGRPRDLEDVRGVLVRHPECDREYVERWLAEFEDAMGIPFRERFLEIVSDANG
jgi:predicted nucleotidyltransferase